jgi:site-specific DNA recombinase
MIAAIYARKSTEQTGVADDAKSVARQIERATAYATRKGWRVDPAYVFTDNAVSGAEFQRRPGFLRLMNTLKRPSFQVLVMMDEDRLGREQIETAWALKQLIVAGVRVFSYLQDRERTLGSPTEKLLLSVSTFADEMEREKARQRTYDALRRKAERGEVTGGRTYGYDTASGGDGKVVRRINPVEAAIVRELLEGYVAGRGFTRLAKALNARAVPPPRNGRRGWGPTAIRDLLKRELYRGVIIWNASRKRDTWGATRPTRRPEAEWVRVKAPALQIVSDELWADAQARRTRLQRTTRRASSGRLRGRPAAENFVSPYLLTGLARCAECGGSLGGFTSRHGRRQPPFYACATHVKRGGTVCGNSTVVGQAVIERAFLDALVAVLDTRMIEDAVRLALERLRHDGDARLGQREVLEREQSLIDARTRHILDAVKSGYATTVLLQELEREEARKSAIVTELAALADLARVASLDVAQVSRTLTTLATDMRAVLIGAPGPARQMLRALFTKHRIACAPIVQPDGTRGYRFRAEGTYAALLSGRAALDGQFPSGIRTRARGLGAIGDRQGRDAGAKSSTKGTSNGQQPEGQTVTAGVPPQAARGGARSGQTPEVSDSKLARRVPRSQPLPRDPLAGEHERKRLRPKTVELSPGSTSRRHGDLRPA